MSRRREVDVLVIGGGQSGLAAGYYLHRLHRDARRGRGKEPPSYAILDAAEAPGGAWREYWDSLELFSPADYSSLPGFLMPHWSGPGNPSAEHVVEYLEEYERRYDLPVHRPVRATAVRSLGAEGEASGENPDQDPGARFEVETDAGDTWRARVVISATGNWRRPFVPLVPGAGEFAGEQLHTAGYRSPDRFAGKRVVVVGGGNSGAQIAADVAPVARSLTWATRTPPAFLPDDVDGRELFRLANEQLRALQRGEPDPGGVGSLGDIVSVRPVRKAREAGLLDASPMFSRLTETGPCWDDGVREPADVIIWCTGFRPDLGHLAPLELPREGGRVATSGELPTSVDGVDGLFLLGYGNWCGPASATLVGVGAFARATVRAAVEML